MDEINNNTRYRILNAQGAFSSVMEPDLVMKQIEVDIVNRLDEEKNNDPIGFFLNNLKL